jgi:hypothetical protein
MYTEVYETKITDNKVIPTQKILNLDDFLNDISKAQVIKVAQNGPNSYKHILRIDGNIYIGLTDKEFVSTPPSRPASSPTGPTMKRSERIVGEVRKRSPCFSVEEEQELIALATTKKMSVNGMIRSWVIERLDKETGPNGKKSY